MHRPRIASAVSGGNFAGLVAVDGNSDWPMLRKPVSSESCVLRAYVHANKVPIVVKASYTSSPRTHERVENYISFQSEEFNEPFR